MKKLMVISACAALMIAFACACDAVAVGPRVNVMPDGIRAGTTDTAYAWAGDAVDVWGNVKWGTSTSGNYVWSFGDGSADATGAVSNAKNIQAYHTYAGAGTYYATLTVTDGNGLTDTDQVRIDVIAAVDQALKVSKAIKRGLKELYINQQANGRWNEARGFPPAASAVSILAFENYGHRPINDPNDDIYQETVKAGLDYLCSVLYYYSPCPVQAHGNPDAHGIYPTPGTPDGRMMLLNWDRNNYQIGMLMMAFAAAGPYVPGSNPYDAALNPALNLTGTCPRWEGGTITLRYHDILANMIDYSAWAQSDSGGARGGWRYTSDSGDSDTSVCQWPAIGMEAAEYWGLFAPAFVKSELLIWCAYSQHPTTGGWSYQHYSDTSTHNVTHAGAGICMLSYCAIPKTDPRVVATLNWLSVPANWAGNGNWYPWNLHMQGGTETNYYGMYAIAKGCRIARDGLGHISEITSIGSIDWYTAYCNHILGQMLSDGVNGDYWRTTMGGYHGWELNTPWALLILEPTVASLRPQAVLNASPNPTNAGFPVAFSVGSSYHQNPANYLTNWDLDWNGDGVFEDHGTFPAADPVATHAFPDIGSNYTKTAKLMVTDNDGVTDDGDLVISITTGNLPPVPNAGGPYNGIVNQVITLDGSASYDPNPGDYIDKYAWDINGDGVYGDPVTPVPGHPEKAQVTWTTPYAGVIGLKCTDKFGAWATAQVYAKITITDLQPVKYTLISYRRVLPGPGVPSRNVWEYTWSFTMTNKGNGAASNVVAVLGNWPSNIIKVVDGQVIFGTIDPLQQVTPADRFTLWVDRSIPIVNKDMTWKVDWDDVGGHHWTLANMPLFM